MKTVYLQNFRRELDATDDAFAASCCKKLGIPRDALVRMRIVRQALDARKKQDVFLCTHAELTLSDAAAKKVLHDPKLKAELVEPAAEEPFAFGTREPEGRIVVVGLGPAGLFAALTLAENGYRPLVIERGRPIEERVKDVETYWSGSIREPDPDSNVAFGEGGAGTFSDGKLTTRIRDPHIDGVLREMIACGAPDEIAYLAKPHIGTDRLRTVVGNLRKRIEAAGGEVRFSAKLADLRMRDGAVREVLIREKDRETWEPCAALLLAMGHGARDTARMLFEKGVAMAPKAFAIGVRAEHPQSLINESQYGPMANHPRLGAAEYRLTARSGERGVYTFCMCPGGQVVASASGKEQVVVNGMSNFARDGRNANAAVVVQITPEDFGTHPLDGMRYLDRLERDTFLLGGGDGTAPASTVGAFLRNEVSKPSRSVEPTYRPGVRYTHLADCLPDFAAKGIAEGLKAFGRQLKGYDMEDAVLTAVESRTSSPLRILRDSAMESVSHKGLYPIGEGAGYAGGIVSAAVDGMKAAETVMRIYAPLP
ncbi:MAG: hypothetical protein IJI34_03755 [Clostridia bacterium]|nr:hypothetical protein [Clostridia bacterium]